ncbi:MAG: KUP/HAK/KT family potassium transporter [Rubritepida sp.]|nr:KUP/HAK/KT family potassium transporter [Rubritepida sp.]
MGGAWSPVAIAAVLILFFGTWARERGLQAAKLAQAGLPLASFSRSTTKVPRVPGLAVYFTQERIGVPTALLHRLSTTMRCVSSCYC